MTAQNAHLLADPRVGDWGIRRVGADAPLAGRVGALLFAAFLVLVAVGLVLALAFPDVRLPLPAAATWAGLVLTLLGLAGVVGAQLAMGPSWRVGVDLQERTELVTDGPFALVRNPIFSAMGVTLLGLTLMVPTHVTIATVVLFFLGVQLQVRAMEEPYLRRVHGPDYADYASRTGRFVPRLRRRL